MDHYSRLKKSDILSLLKDRDKVIAGLQTQMSEQSAKATALWADHGRCRPHKEAKPLVILGNGPTMAEGLACAKSMPGCDAWAINMTTFPEITMLWQIHGEYLLNSKRWLIGQGQDSWFDFVKAKPEGLPVMMQRVYKEIPNSMAFPLAEVTEHFYGSREAKMYSANSVSYMLAYALWRRCFNPIFLYGVDYHYWVHHESRCERPCTEYWIGRARQAGFNVITPHETTLFTIGDFPRSLYGYEFNPDISTIQLGSGVVPYEWNSYGHGAKPAQEQVDNEQQAEPGKDSETG